MWMSRLGVTRVVVMSGDNLLALVRPKGLEMSERTAQVSIKLAQKLPEAPRCSSGALHRHIFERKLIVGDPYPDTTFER